MGEELRAIWKIVKYLSSFGWAAAVGGLLLLLIFKKQCVEFSGFWEWILIKFEVAISSFTWMFAVIPNFIATLLDFPRPTSDVWEIAFTLAFFHQARTFPFEFAQKDRRVAASWAGLCCGLIGASLSYCFGLFFPEPAPLYISLFIASLYGLLEFMRYTILALMGPKNTSGGFRVEFVRRHRLYTLPYTIFGLSAALLSWLIFDGSQAELPFFAIMLFTLLGSYILGLEVYFQMRAKLGRSGYTSVPFHKSTRTQTVLVFLGSCGICLSVLVVEVASDFSFSALCTVPVE